MKLSHARAVGLATGTLLGVFVLGCGSSASSSDAPSAPPDAATIGVDAGAGADAAAGPDAAVVADAAIGAEEPATGGSRLRARWLVTDDGTSEFPTPDMARDGWLDTQLNTTCRFGTAADGVLRCLPRPPGFSTGYFADANCTQAVALRGHDGCSSQPDVAQYIAAVESASSCSSRTHVFGGNTLVHPAAIYSVEGGACRKVDIIGDTDLDSYALGPEVTPASFVAAHEEAGVAASGLAPIDLHAEDGARAFDHWTDVARQTACAFGTAADGASRCLPVPAAYVSGFFADAACTTAVAASSACSAPFLVGYTSDACPRTRIFAVGAALPGLPYGRGTSCVGTVCTQSCQQLTTSPFATPFTWSSVGDEIAASDFVLGAAQGPTGPGRIQARSLALPGGRTQRVDWIDSQVDTRCAFGVAADGEVRCLPIVAASLSIGPAQSHFADAACTQAIVPSSPSCDGSPPRHYKLTDESCPRQSRVYTLGAEVTAASIYAQSPGGPCVSVGKTGRFYALGSEVAASQFQAAQLVLR